MGFKGKMSRWKQDHFRIGNITFEGMGTGGKEIGVILPPNCQQRWPPLAQESLKICVKLDIRSVVKEVVQLRFLRAWTSEIEVVEVLPIGPDFGGVTNARLVLRFGRSGGESSPK